MMYRWEIDLGPYGVCQVSIYSDWHQPGEALIGLRGSRVNYFLDVVCGMDLKQVTPLQLHEALLSQTPETGMIGVGPQTQPRQIATVTLIEGDLPGARGTSPRSSNA
jgi:hypothetical protein